MIPQKLKDLLKKQHYELVGNHSAVQICGWAKNSMRNSGFCYKQKFYGIKSHLCCQMTPSVMWCPNQCIHCWRAIENTLGEKLPSNIDDPKKIIDGCISAQRKLLIGFKKDPKSKKPQMSKANMKKFREAQEPMQFAISLSGEPTIYPKIGELIEELNRRGKTSFLVTNGLYPEKLEEIIEKNQLPTQLYISVNSPSEELYQGIHRSIKKNPWQLLNKSLELMNKIKNKTRTVFRMNLIKGVNMDDSLIGKYASLIKKSNPWFIEVKAYMNIGYSRKRLTPNHMPTQKEIEEFSKKLIKELGSEYKILERHVPSRVVVIGKNKKLLNIAKNCLM